MVLKLAMNVVEIIVGTCAALTLGDYLGYKIGRKRMASYILVVVLTVIVAFAYTGWHRACQIIYKDFTFFKLMLSLRRFFVFNAASG